MARDWESVFTTWSQGPSKTEEERAENAERQIRQAIQASDKLKNRSLTIFTQGSYRNRVNVRRDSDVDIGVLCHDTYFSEYLNDDVKAQLAESFVPASYEYATFKNEIEEALVTRFGRSAVTRGNKAFDIKANTYRVESDVAAFFEHKHYTSATHHHSGVELRPDNLSPPRVINWPEQHYQSGVTKNTQTSRRYKRVVRIIKTLSNEMADGGIASAKNAPGFLIECLVFNVPNASFNYSTFKERVKMVLAHLIVNTGSDEECSEWVEVSGLKWLFRGSQPWTRQEAYQFSIDAWNYIGY